MFQIIDKTQLSNNVAKMNIDAPRIAKKAKPGQFIILRVDKHGERIPLTVHDTNIEKGFVTIVYQVVGASTRKLDQLNKGDFIEDFVGPLGKPTDLKPLKRICIIGGGVGCAIAFPISKAYFEQGVIVDTIIGFRDKSFIMLENDFKQFSNNCYVMTDNGSNGNKGFVTDQLLKILQNGTSYDEIFAVGPLLMMKNVTNVAHQYQIPCIVSMNPIMIDGTGMCGGCRLTVNNTMKFACVDGPDFDGYQVDFDEMIARNRMYEVHEKKKHDELCRLLGDNRDK